MSRHLPKPASPVDLRRSKHRPSPERQAEMEHYLYDRQTMRVYGDCSASHVLQAFGIAATYVYDGSVLVRSRQARDPSQRLQATYGELLAVRFALERCPSIVGKAVSMPEKIVIYSDVDHIEHLLRSESGDTFGASQIQEIRAARELLVQRWPTVNMDICYLPPQEQKHNPYYSSSHNVAQKAVMIRKR